LVEGRRVRLRYDAERQDRYGRTLAYVFRSQDGLFVNAELVRRGYATTLTIPPTVAHADDFRQLARGARRAGRGLWSAC
jgi:micrococcal nuclease